VTLRLEKDRLGHRFSNSNTELRSFPDVLKKRGALLDPSRVKEGKHFVRLAGLSNKRFPIRQQLTPGEAGGVCRRDPKETERDVGTR